MNDDSRYREIFHSFLVLTHTKGEVLQIYQIGKLPLWLKVFYHINGVCIGIEFYSPTMSIQPFEDETGTNNNG